MRLSTRVPRARSERGQSSVLAALLCGMLIVVVAMTTNIGKLVTEKIQMQNAIDLAAYSGAATQANYLNRMRNVNQQIWQVAYDTRDRFDKSAQCPAAPTLATGMIPQPCDPFFQDVTLTSSCPGTCRCTQAANSGPIDAQGQGQADDWAKNIQQAQIDSLEQTFDGLNQKGYSQSKKNAGDAADRNYNGLGSPNLFTGYEGNYNNRMVKTDQTIVDVSYFGWCLEHTLAGTYIHRAKVTTSPQIKNGSGLVAWLYKDEQGDVMFAAKAENAHPVNSAFMDFPTNPYFMKPQDPCWGGNSQKNGRCGLNVYAAAAPFYGKLASQDCQSLIPGNSCGGNGTNRNRWNKGDDSQPDQADDLNNDKPKSCGDKNGYCDYRVRFVGIFEDEVNYVGNQQQAENNFLPSWVAGRIQH